MHWFLVQSIQLIQLNFDYISNLESNIQTPGKSDTSAVAK